LSISNKAINFTVNLWTQTLILAEGSFTLVG